MSDKLCYQTGLVENLWIHGRDHVSIPSLKGCKHGVSWSNITCLFSMKNIVVPLRWEVKSTLDVCKWRLKKELVPAPNCSGIRQKNIYAAHQLQARVKSEWQPRPGLQLGHAPNAFRSTSWSLVITKLQGADRNPLGAALSEPGLRLPFTVHKKSTIDVWLMDFSLWYWCSFSNLHR